MLRSRAMLLRVSHRVPLVPQRVPCQAVMVTQRRDLATAGAENPTRHERNAFDTLAFSKQLQASGLPRAQAEALTHHVLDVIAAADTYNRSEFAFKDQIAQCRSELSTGLEHQRASTQRYARHIADLDSIAQTRCAALLTRPSVHL